MHYAALAWSRACNRHCASIRCPSPISAAARVAVRNIRRDANDQFKKLVKDKMCSEDDERHAQSDMQKLTDRFIADVDRVMQTKETDLMAI